MTSLMANDINEYLEDMETQSIKSMEKEQFTSVADILKLAGIPIPSPRFRVQGCPGRIWV